jgi:hypothetical protein
MTKKFAVLAVLATMFVACGGPSAAELEAKAKATADSLAAVAKADSMAKAAEAAAQQAMQAVDSTAGAMVDSAAAAVAGH